MGGMRRRKGRGLTPDDLLVDPDALAALLAGLRRGGRQGLNAWAWAVGWIRDNRCAPMALRVLERYRREKGAAMSARVTVAAIPGAEGGEGRAQLVRPGGRGGAAPRARVPGREGRRGAG